MIFDRDKPGKAIAHDAWGTTAEGWRLNVCAERYGHEGQVKIFATPAGCTISLRMAPDDARALAAELLAAADSLTVQEVAA